MRTKLTCWIATASIFLAMGMPAAAQDDLDQRIDSNINDWVGTYKHLHEHPELSTEEKETSALVAAQLKKMGYDVTDHFGKYDSGLAAYGVVAVLRNGAGPTLYVRTDMDALPVTENTGLPYASKVREKRPNGEVGVMHACGHDLHMTVLMGTAKMMTETKDKWSGTLVPTVVTVGSFHAGTKHNIIPDEAHLQLTVRTMTPAQREKVLVAIKRITNGITEAAGIPAERAPIIEIAKDNVPATINDPALTQRVAVALEKSLGKANVWPGQPIMASEDFSLFALEDPKPPITMFWLGATDPAKWKDAQEKGTRLPGPHSSEFAPLPEPAIRTGVKAMTGVATELLHK